VKRRTILALSALTFVIGGGAVHPFGRVRQGGTALLLHGAEITRSTWHVFGARVGTATRKTCGGPGTVTWRRHRGSSKVMSRGPAQSLTFRAGLSTPYRNASGACPPWEPF
jgi:hypothetical protein